MKLSYYPGCTMKSHAANFEESLLYAMKHLGVDVEEIDRWNCCGTVYSLLQENAMRQLAPIRNLIRVKEANASRVMTACSMCYNTLKRANDRVKADPALLKRMNGFMSDETVSYEGEVEVVHTLEILRELKSNSGAISAKVVKPLNGLRVACYYGCLLARPRSVAFDNVEDPVLLDELVAALGGEPVDFSQKTECCGAYQTVDKPEISPAAPIRSCRMRASKAPIWSRSAARFARSTSIGARKSRTACTPASRGFPSSISHSSWPLPLAAAKPVLKLDLHHNSPRPVLAAKGLL